MAKPDNVGKYDFGLINITGRNVGQSPIINNIDSETYAELLIESNNIITSHGTHLCKSGLSTHVTCGYVRGLGAVLVYANGVIEDNFILYGKDSFETSCEGDSGGPVYSYLQSLLKVNLIGIHSSHLKDFSASLPLDIILREGELELVKVSG
ncbi:hypothetical protein F8M41_016676 [Gigaspora margarita]|uniref:Peptidase S1 domain-containing protein n=1 Tax=Gigaspora margarita TaxID=4874 RepID=A0A8H4ANX1_GIGMA|nr:hypothetical protein F8M41_016676 [Gigaspora margarita]